MLLCGTLLPDSPVCVVLSFLPNSSVLVSVSIGESWPDEKTYS